MKITKKAEKLIASERHASTPQKRTECDCCGKVYNYDDEPEEVKQGGQHICPECWEEEE